MLSILSYFNVSYNLVLFQQHFALTTDMTVMEILDPGKPATMCQRYLVVRFENVAMMMKIRIVPHRTK